MNLVMDDSKLLTLDNSERICFITHNVPHVALFSQEMVEDFRLINEFNKIIQDENVTDDEDLLTTLTDYRDILQEIRIEQNRNYGQLN